MARTKGPLMSLDASGTVADTIVFSKWKGRNYVRRHAVPSNPRSGLQVGMRAVLKYISQSWAGLDAAIKTEWEELGKAKSITGLNAMTSDAGTRARNNEGWVKTFTATPLGDIDPPTGVTLTPGFGSLLVEWTRPVADQGDYTAAVYLDITDTDDGLIEQLEVIVDVTTTSVTIPRLEHGLTVFVNVRETSQAGELGTLSASATTTIL